MYKLESNKNDYITATKRKYFKYALEYVLNKTKNGINKNGFINACTVNKISFIFEFEKNLVYIKSDKDDRFYKHNLIKAA